MASRAQGSGGSAELLAGAAARRAPPLTPPRAPAGAGVAALTAAAPAGMALQSPAPREGGPAIPARAADAGLLPKGLADLPDDYGDTARIAKYLPATAA